MNLDYYDDSISKIMCKFYPDDEFITINKVNVIKQANGNDCGLHAWAFAWCMFNKVSPHNFILNFDNNISFIYSQIRLKLRDYTLKYTNL